MYDITEPESFKDVKNWLKGTNRSPGFSRRSTDSNPTNFPKPTELRSNMSPDLIIHVVGSKADLSPQRKVELVAAQRTLAVWDQDLLAKYHPDSRHARSQALSPPSALFSLSSSTSPYSVTSDLVAPSPLPPNLDPRPRARTLSTRRTNATPSIVTSAAPASSNAPLHISASSSISNVSAVASGIQPLTALGGIAAAAAGIPTMFGTRVRTLSSAPSLGGGGGSGVNGLSAGLSDYGGGGGGGESLGMARSGSLTRSGSMTRSGSSKLSLGPPSAGGRGGGGGRSKSFDEDRRNANVTSSTTGSKASSDAASPTAEVAIVQEEETEEERVRIDALVDQCVIQVSEVSAKEDWGSLFSFSFFGLWSDTGTDVISSLFFLKLGIEEVFLNIAQQLVVRKARIESQRILRTRDSVMLTDVASGQSNSGAEWCAC